MLKSAFLAIRGRRTVIEQGDESQYFAWSSQRLMELGFNFGDMPTHNFCWRVQKLMGVGDHKTPDIVAIISEKEVAHIAIDVFWFTQLCQTLDRASSDTFKRFVERIIAWS
ncbi:hypothetical protein MA16_Dca004754 [Dendrobium catenatum]|uniref:Uncharacterized protein n=1 Tax=Dendrobium catenatum TaxID=906689 RepID=A0A2I0VNZ8_9ASPA|nr:hypothetical protein MA16_Dca004754 [Dendrobium catenatum]